MSFQCSLTDSQNVRELRANCAELVRLREQLRDVEEAERVAREQYSSAQLCLWTLQGEREMVENRIAELEAA